MLNIDVKELKKNRKYLKNLISFIPFLLCFVSQIKFYKKPYKKSSFFLSEPVGTTLLGSFFFGEILPPIVLYSIKIEESVILTLKKEPKKALYFFTSTP